MSKRCDNSLTTTFVHLVRLVESNEYTFNNITSLQNYNDTFY